ncbi:MAG TPA: acyl-CoA thioesterase [Thermoclostridium caenicola]|uniref:Acyl-CoA hydrolase n=1 Tax=Thermoclostridium caenicola TaxID=659425 RepID=A0A1M6HFH8_9FIRM|nr:acyl-CoA thioesterase [Thermoclostridium caenicola]SHJ20926.1 Acyl-CoA hydrolase [Thermoclostridium caenicola]HOK42526.1 acyl-CoA thioesterase [Thermoclostridium caenicola]HOL85428.1 acyl-CoA thioesterase [Thermoclostridium caenicola]HPO76687.1 acyl-CoA thioesterase [Thermoclostridium caenicola]
MNAKSPKESMIEMNELVLPNDTNLLGNLLGGTLLHWVDIVGAMAAQKHANSVVATVCMDSVDFREPVHMGEIVTLKARVTWVGRTSMEVIVEVFAEDYLKGRKRFTNKAYVTYVSVDENGKPREVPGLILETEEQKREFAEAEKRRAERLSRRQSRQD